MGIIILRKFLHLFFHILGWAILVVGGWGYDRDVLRTSIVNPFQKSPGCNTNDIIEPSSDEKLGSDPMVTNGKYVCTFDKCFTFGYNPDIGHLKYWQYVDLKIPWNFYIWYGSASVVTSEYWWITSGWINEPSRNTIILRRNETNFVPGPEFPQIKYAHCMAAINYTTVFVAGNSYGGGCQDSYFIDTSADPFKFGTKKKLNRCRSGAGCGMLSYYRGEKQVPIIAGGDFDGDKISTEVFDMKKQEWVMGPKLRRPFSDGGYVSIDNHFLLLGGRFYDKKFKNIMGYNDVTQEFEILESELPKGFGYESNGGRAGFSAAILNETSLLCN